MLPYTSNIQQHLESYTSKMGSWEIPEGTLLDLYNNWMNIQNSHCSMRLIMLIIKIRMEETKKIIEKIKHFED